jgi:thiosulfate dehydrogenase [quinone] large subunit
MSRRRHPEPPRARSVAPRAEADQPPTAPRSRPVTRGTGPAAAAPDAAYRALLPLRFFLGGMFLYAGVDKLVDPAFLQAAGPGSVAAQLEAFTRVSPLAPLITAFAQPFPVAIGFLIALVEIAVGLGALTGILYRWSAWLGAALSALFFLTASWDTRPIYYGADLPYMVGWATLALAGSGGLLVLEGPLLARLRGVPLPRALADDGTPASAGRRAVLEAGALGIAAIGIAVVARVFGRVASPLFTDSTAVAPPGPTPGPSAVAAATPGSGASAAPAASAAANEVANANQMAARSSTPFLLPTGDPAAAIKLADGTIVCYDTVCTHEGCEVAYDAQSGLLLCPCHGAAFDPAHDAAVVNGPARRPLTPVPIRVDPATGAITLVG